MPASVAGPDPVDGHGYYPTVRSPAGAGAPPGPGESGPIRPGPGPGTVRRRAARLAALSLPRAQAPGRARGTESWTLRLPGAVGVSHPWEMRAAG
eukprot:245611-Hanusia_phi.AAC.1